MDGPKQDSQDIDPKRTATEAIVAMRTGGRCTVDEYNQWLLRLHEHFTDRLLSDNSRIWQTGAIFVPIALAAFGALTTIKAPVAWWQVLVLGVPSTLLMWLWLVIAENHRAFQKKSEAWLFAIEEARGFFARHAPNKYASTGHDRHFIFPGVIQKARWWLAFGVGTSWVLLLVLSTAGKLA